MQEVPSLSVRSDDGGGPQALCRLPFVVLNCAAMDIIDIAVRLGAAIPWQDDFPRGNVPTGKGALRSIHWKLDNRPISMKLYEFAAIDGPEQTSAPEMHQRIIAMATEQGPRIPA
jgi:hypothetical protein